METTLLLVYSLYSFPSLFEGILFRELNLKLKLEIIWHSSALRHWVAVGTLAVLVVGFLYFPPRFSTVPIKPKRKMREATQGRDKQELSWRGSVQSLQWVPLIKAVWKWPPKAESVHSCCSCTVFIHRFLIKKKDHSSIQHGQQQNSRTSGPNLVRYEQIIPYHLTYVSDWNLSMLIHSNSVYKDPIAASVLYELWTCNTYGHR